MNPHITQLLVSVRSGDDDALDDLLAALQDELRTMAARHLSKERANHTLQPTALVNEAYLKLIDQRDRSWEDKDHFFAIASTAMRRVLLESARARLADKRGGGAQAVTLFEAASVLEEEPESLIALDEALIEFAKIDPEGSRIVELRWFGGLSNDEVAKALQVSTRTVERSWRASRAWLRDRLTSE
tara:strand:- start:758 stop:1315 length:558 start_codon:yes stop_codon:yes gene_type:complete